MPQSNGWHFPAFLGVLERIDQDDRTPVGRHQPSTKELENGEEPGLDPENPRRHGPYYKLSYVHQGKFTTQFIRKEALKQVRIELSNYNKFRQLSARWIDLALQLAKLKLTLLS